MIEVNETIDVPSDPKTVWALLSNPREVVECVAGATLGEQAEPEDGELLHVRAHRTEPDNTQARRHLPRKHGSAAVLDPASRAARAARTEALPPRTP